MRYLGIDLGRARIGLAIADEVLRTARPHSTVHRRSDAVVLAAIAEVAKEYEVTLAVLGLPLNMDGTEGDSARFARGFAVKLGAALGVPVELHDERLSTFEAEGRLTGRGYDTTGIGYQHVANRLNEVLGVGGWRAHRTVNVKEITRSSLGLRFCGARRSSQ